VDACWQGRGRENTCPFRVHGLVLVMGALQIGAVQAGRGESEGEQDDIKRYREEVGGAESPNYVHCVGWLVGWKDSQQV